MAIQSCSSTTARSVHDFARPITEGRTIRFTATVLTPENCQVPSVVKIHTLVNKTLAVWKEAALERVSLLREKKENIPLSELPKFQEKLSHDLTLVQDGYVDLARFFFDHMKSLQKEPNRRIIILTEGPIESATPTTIQGLLCVHTEKAALYVNTLISPPWNNTTMYSPFVPEHNQLRVKGAGYSLFKLAYAYASKKHLSQIQLLPLTDSLSFYQHIGMDYDGKLCTMPIFKSIPERFSTIPIEGDPKKIVATM